MNDFKATLNMPNTSFDMKAKLNIKEPAVQAKWIEDKIYTKLLNKTSGNEQFTLHDGPPYANGDIHVGHALNKIVKDIIVRQKLMKGYYSLFIPGWDTHGLPIENALSKKMKGKFNELSVAERRNKCKAFALEQVNKQEVQFKRLGLVADFDDVYLTLNKSYEIDQLKVFQKMLDMKLIFQALKPVYWSWSSQTALAEAEIEYGMVSSPSIYVAINLPTNKILNAKTRLIIWTTTPWTLPSNLAIAVHPQFKYIEIEADGNLYLIAESRLEGLTQELEWKNVKIIQTIIGKELEHIVYHHPLYKKQCKVILADYVTDDSGTGLVHNAPGFGIDDYLACKKYGIDVFCPIDNLGKFTEEVDDPELDGMFYEKANKIIGERLDKNQQLLKLKFIKHSVAHDWRTKKPVMYRATKQWFVNIDKLHPQIMKTLAEDVTSPHLKTVERMKEMITNRKEWCISRQRVWGVPIPIIYDANSNPIYDPELINSIITTLDSEGINAWFSQPVEHFLPPKYLDQKGLYKEQDIMDVWFDSGTSHNILAHHDLKYPADIYFEGSDQFRGWFNSSLITGVIMHNKAPYKQLLKHGFVLDEKGLKMSKSVGNVIDPLKICNQYGADVLRLWVANSDFSEDLRIGDGIIKQNAEIYRRIRNTLFRYPLSNIDDFDPIKNYQTKLAFEDEYIMSLIKDNLIKINQAYDKYQYTDIIKSVNQLTLDFSNWYFAIIKDTLYCNAKDDLRRRQIQTVLYNIVNYYMVALAPIMPHTCEEVYKSLKKAIKEPSVMLEKWYDISNIKVDSHAAIFKRFFEIKNDVYVILEKMRKEQIIKENNEVSIVLELEKKLEIDDVTLAIFLKVAQVKTKIGKKFKIHAEKKVLNKCPRCWNYYESSNIGDDILCERCQAVIKE